MNKLPRERNLLLASLGDYQTNPRRLSGERLAATYKHLSFTADCKGLLIVTECLCLGHAQGRNLSSFLMMMVQSLKWWVWGVNAQKAIAIHSKLIIECNLDIFFYF